MCAVVCSTIVFSCAILFTFSLAEELTFGALAFHQSTYRLKDCFFCICELAKCGFNQQGLMLTVYFLPVRFGVFIMVADISSVIALCWSRLS